MLESNLILLSLINAMFKKIINAIGIVFVKRLQLSCFSCFNDEFDLNLVILSYHFHDG